MAEPLKPVATTKIVSGSPSQTVRVLPEEVPVALVYDGSTHAVMMATPQDLEDYALGFSLAEGKIADSSEIAGLDVVEQEAGIELRMWMSPGAGHRLAVRRRAMLGPTGCGLCGLESLEEALPPLGTVKSNLKVSAVEIEAAVASLAPAQKLNSEARALHAAGFWTLDRGLVALREDVGRHNALDKLAGALSRAALDASAGLVVLTSRISVELVQKAVRMGAQVLVAVSAPTALAVRVADAAGITLVGIARDESFEIFTHAERVTSEPVRRSVPVRHSFEEPVHALC
jgi:FdhD protein